MLIHTMGKTIKIFVILSLFFGLSSVVFKAISPRRESAKDNPPVLNNMSAPQEETKAEEILSMSIAALRAGKYPGGDFTIEKNLPNGTNYRQYIASYKSERFKIFGLLTVPLALKPEKGFPAVIFVHGYISPKQYSTTGNYPSYQATLARSGVVTFKPDLRGHGESEGEAVSAHYSEKYVVDVLYSLSYLKNYSEVDPARIGYWGHSNGGEMGLKLAVLTPDIKAFVFWAGVIGSSKDMLETYNDKIGFLRNESNPLVEEYGLPSQNPEFWKKIDPYFYLNDISASVELHHGTADDSVPIELSRHLNEELKKAGKKVEFFEYPGDDHNIAKNSGLAWQRSIDFFKNNL